MIAVGGLVDRGVARGRVAGRSARRSPGRVEPFAAVCTTHAAPVAAAVVVGRGLSPRPERLVGGQRRAAVVGRLGVGRRDPLEEIRRDEGAGASESHAPFLRRHADIAKGTMVVEVWPSVRRHIRGEEW